MTDHKFIVSLASASDNYLTMGELNRPDYFPPEYLLLLCLLGIDSFKGVYFHSRDYKTPEQWRNKKVVVIGIGNSGGDIAVELSRFSKQVHQTLSFIVA